MYKKSLFVALLVASVSWNSTAIADPAIAWSLEGFDQPESVLLDPTSQQLLVSNINGAPLELNGKGYISKISMDGQLLEKYWAQGFDAPKGMAIVGDKLYVADLQNLHLVERNSGKILTSYFAAESKMLNDVSIDSQGNVYVSDLIAGGVYRLQQGKFQKWLSSDLLPHPNGLFIQQDQLYIATWGRKMQADFSTKTPGKVYQLALADSTKKLRSISGPMGNLDGIATHRGRLFINDWINGNVFSLKDGQSELLFNAGPGAADISLYDGKLIVPMMLDNKLDVYQIDDIDLIN
ncbi:MAG: hypothetical protein MJK10_08310 [Pseudomonadales bacterium]|nr:hypothetical protein [Pseudomonadales bacterium]NRA15829.1 hypothetical protein [Oceanospirillaceae bacterium]